MVVGEHRRLAPLPRVLGRVGAGPPPPAPPREAGRRALRVGDLRPLPGMAHHGGPRDLDQRRRFRGLRGSGSQLQESDEVESLQSGDSDSDDGPVADLHLEPHPLLPGRRAGVGEPSLPSGAQSGEPPVDRASELRALHGTLAGPDRRVSGLSASLPGRRVHGVGAPQLPPRPDQGVARRSGKLRASPPARRQSAPARQRPPRVLASSRGGPTGASSLGVSLAARATAAGAVSWAGLAPSSEWQPRGAWAAEVSPSQNSRAFHLRGARSVQSISNSSSNSPSAVPSPLSSSSSAPTEEATSAFTLGSAIRKAMEQVSHSSVGKPGTQATGAGVGPGTQAIGAGVWYNSTQIIAHMPFFKIMRDAPTMTTSSNTFAKVYLGGSTTKPVDDSTPFDLIKSSVCRLNLGVSASGTSGHGAMVQTQTSAYVYADAEV